MSFSPTFYEQILRQYSLAKKLQSRSVIREKLGKVLSHEKKHMKNVDEFDYRAACNTEPDCLSYYYSRNRRECFMMSTTLAEHLNNIQTLGGPKYCSGQIEICVKVFFPL